MFGRFEVLSQNETLILKCIENIFFIFLNLQHQLIIEID